jgi:hypothetical protein
VSSCAVLPTNKTNLELLFGRPRQFNFSPTRGETSDLY